MMSFLLFLLILSVLVLSHEAGHFFAARWAGVKAEEFGYGFPPRLFGFVKVDGHWKRVSRNDTHAYKNTIWSVNWLPLGGFVRLKGEQGEAVDQPDSFSSATLPKRFIIISAGVIMNWLLAVAIFSAGFLVGVPAQTDGLPSSAIIRDEKVQIASVLADSPAAKAGIQPGDFVIAINHQPLNKAEAVKQALQQNSETTASFPILIEQQGQQKEFMVQPAFINELNHTGVGVALANTGIVRFPWYKAVPSGVSVAAHQTWAIIKGFGELIVDLFGPRKLAGSVSGPVGIAVLTSQLAKQGTWTLLSFAAMLSLNLAVINFLPIPALDGGRALFLLFEAIRRKKITPRLEAMVHGIGFLGLMALIAIVTIKDVRQYGGMIWHGVKHIVGF